jgi:hypothetical protein
MKFGKACFALRNPDPGSNIERLPCYTRIDKEISKLDKSRRSNGFTKRFGKNLATREIAYLRTL